jgi:hypothetical protein
MQFLGSVHHQHLQFPCWLAAQPAVAEQLICVPNINGKSNTPCRGLPLLIGQKAVVVVTHRHVTRSPGKFGTVHSSPNSLRRACTYYYSARAPQDCNTRAGTVSCGASVTVNAVPASCYDSLIGPKQEPPVSQLALYIFYPEFRTGSLVAIFALVTYAIKRHRIHSGGELLAEAVLSIVELSLTLTATPTNVILLSPGRQKMVSCEHKPNTTAFNATVSRTFGRQLVAASAPIQSPPAQPWWP